MKQIKAILLLLIFQIPLIAFAGEGMWLPLLLKSLNEKEMKAMGMKMSAEDIYSVNHGSLKDAIVHFGGFCTSEIISANGLLLTNHHCGYGQIQSHSTVENNYLRDGFWAKSHKEELPNPGLTATFIVRIEDVTKVALKDVKNKMSSEERQSQIDKNLDAYKKSMRLGPFQEISIKPFYEGNQYFMFVTVTYNDVRLVGAPPESIGKFGSDTDNWVFPRHTGDFSLFRIYAGPDNQPAEYNEENVPFKPKHYLPISLDGVEEDDFTLVFGFPGRTDQYLPAVAVEQIIDVLNPARIDIRDRALKIVDSHMRQDEEIKIKYASKYARIANYWKKWIGESQGLKSTNAVKKKMELEAEFTEIVGNKKKYAKQYGQLLDDFTALYKEIEPYAFARDYYNEVAVRNIEIFRLTGLADRLVNAFENNGQVGYDGFKARLIPFLGDFYKDYEPKIDQEVFAALLEMYVQNVDVEYTPASILKMKESYETMAKAYFKNSMFANEEKTMLLLNEMPAEKAIEAIKADPLYKLGMEWKAIYDEKISGPYNEIQTKINDRQRIYMEALMEVFPKKRFFPDANSTMRVTYGKVNGYHPKDAVYYEHVSYIDGIMEKYQPGDYEFDVPQKLIELYENKDYGQYADKNGKVPVCFIGSNHTTGGNSGSPAIDAYGNLIGLNFDRVWEGTMSDINYDERICRNIMVDARYILFIIDKYAGADHLIKEMTLVHPKGRK
jgi:hypothetical protein